MRVAVPLIILATTALAGCSGEAIQSVVQNSAQKAFHEDVMINADLWT